MGPASEAKLVPTHILCLFGMAVCCLTVLAHKWKSFTPRNHRGHGAEQEEHDTQYQTRISCYYAFGMAVPYCTDDLLTAYVHFFRE